MCWKDGPRRLIQIKKYMKYIFLFETQGFTGDFFRAIASCGVSTPFEERDALTFARKTSLSQRRADKARQQLAQQPAAGTDALGLGRPTPLIVTPANEIAAQAAASMASSPRLQWVRIQPALTAWGKTCPGSEREGPAASGSALTSEEAARIVADLRRALSGDGIEFHNGVSYRHLMVWRGGINGTRLTPPHDITGQPVESHLPAGDGANRPTAVMPGAA